MSGPIDRLGRTTGVLRLSLTSRCNLACPYCLPEGQEPPELLNLDERLLLIEVAAGLGFRQLRLTGGEPLLHAGLETLVERVSRSALIDDLSLTSNGLLLSAARALRLRQAGLQRLTLSLDGTDAASVARMGGSDPQGGEAQLQRALAAIEHARGAGFDPALGALKLNAVIARHLNDDQVLPLAELARARGIELRLIELMDVGNRNGWSWNQVVPAAEMIERINQRWPLDPLGRAERSTAQRWRYRDGGGTLAIVASITQPFCGDCNRLRVTADGIAYSCLFAASGLDLKPWLRPSPDPRGLEAALRGLWQGRSDRYSEERGGAAAHSKQLQRPHAEMAYLGG